MLILRVSSDRGETDVDRVTTVSRMRRNRAPLGHMHRTGSIRFLWIAASRRSAAGLIAALVKERAWGDQRPELGG
jgi:hypothetical protein